MSRAGAKRGVLAVLIGLGTALGVAAFLRVVSPDDRPAIPEQPDHSKTAKPGPTPPPPKPPPGPVASGRATKNPGREWLGGRALAPEQERSDRIEKTLLSYLIEGDAEGLRGARFEARAFASEFPDHIYAQLLLAYTHRLAGESDAEADVLATLEPWARATYDYFFERPGDDVGIHMRCNRMMTCFIREAMRGQPLPASSVFNFYDMPLNTGPVTCGDMTLHPATCPDSYAIYERIGWTCYSRDRARRWSAGQPEPVSMDEFMQLIGVEPGMRVADIGAGQGYFTWALAKAVGEMGKVFAVEIDDRFLRFIETSARHQGLTHVETVFVEPGDIGLQPGSVDLVFVSQLCQDLLNEDEAARAADGTSEGVARPFVRSVAQALAPGGTMVVVDHKKHYGRERKDHVSDELITALVASGGLEKVAQHDVFEPVHFVAAYSKQAP